MVWDECNAHYVTFHFENMLFDCFDASIDIFIISFKTNYENGSMKSEQCHVPVEVSYLTTKSMDRFFMVTQIIAYRDTDTRDVRTPHSVWKLKTPRADHKIQHQKIENK